MSGEGTEDISRKQVAAIVAIFLLHIASNFNLPEITLQSAPMNVVGELWACFLLGVLLSQPLLLAMLGYWLPYAFYNHVTLALAALLLLIVPAGVATGTAIVVVWMLVLFVVLLIPFCVLRLWGGLQIVMTGSTATPVAVTRQFSLRSLFLCVSIAAVGCTLLHYGGEAMGWLCAVFLLFLVASLLWMVAVLGERPRIQLACAGLLFLEMACVLIASVERRFPTPRDTAAVACGLMFAIAATLLPLRWCGYRIVRGKD